MGNKTEIQPKDIVAQQLDLLYTGAEEICEAWETKIIPIATIERIIELGTVDLDKVEDEINKIYIEQYNKIIQALLTESHKLILEFDSKGVPLVVFKKCIETLQTSFLEGFDKAKKGEK